MSQQKRTIGTLSHVGSGKDWNRFDFVPFSGGAKISLFNIMAFQTEDKDQSRGGFTLLGIVTAFPGIHAILTQHLGPGEGVVSIECMPEHSREISKTQDVRLHKDHVTASSDESTVPVQVHPLKIDDMPIYQFQGFVCVDQK